MLLREIKISLISMHGSIAFLQTCARFQPICIRTCMYTQSIRQAEFIKPNRINTDAKCLQGSQVKKHLSGSLDVGILAQRKW